MIITSHQHLLITLICHNKLNDINRKMLMVHTSSHQGQIPRSHCWIILGDTVITWMHTLIHVKNSHKIYIRNSSFLKVIVCIILYNTSESLPWVRTCKKPQDQRTEIPTPAQRELETERGTEDKERHSTPLDRRSFHCTSHCPSLAKGWEGWCHHSWQLWVELCSNVKRIRNLRGVQVK